MRFVHLLCLAGFRIVYNGGSTLHLLRYLVCAATTALVIPEMVMMTMLIMIMRMSSGNVMHMTRFEIMNSGMRKQNGRMSESRPVGARSRKMYSKMGQRMEMKAPARRYGMDGSRPDGKGIRPDGKESKERERWRWKRGKENKKSPARRERGGEVRPDGTGDRPGGNGNEKECNEQTEAE